ncbi:hypothetical protein BV378_05730, partial [Nostoc sp. RF31YmG]
MGSPENFGTNNASSSNGGIMPLSLLESASLGAALDDNSALISLQKTLRTPSGSDPINSELASLKKSPNATEDNQSSQDSTNYTSPGSNIFGQEQLSNQPQSFINTSLFPSSNNKNSNKAKDKDSLTGNAKDTSLIGITEQNSLTTGALGIEQSQQNSSPSTAKTNSSASTTNQTTIPNFAIRTEGTISINGSSNFDGVPTDLSDDALIYAAKGFTINGNPTLPVQRDAQGNPIRDASGKLILVDKAVAVAAGYTVTNGPSNQYAGLNPPTVVPQKTVIVPAYADIKQLELAKRIPNGTPTVTFNISQNPINNANDWSKKFPPPGTASNPTVVKVTGGGLNIPANVTLNNYVITVEQGDINFNGNGHNFNNVVLVANNGNINLSNVQARDLSVFASGSINMNGGARFAGSSLLANGSNNGNITFNGATSSTNTTDSLKVISQGDLTYNGASDTRGLFLSVKNFTFNGSSTLYGSISAKGNIIFNGKATVIAVAELMPDITAPVIIATLARDTAPLGQTNTDKITFDPAIAGTVIDASPILEFRAGFNNTPLTNYTNVIAQRNSDGSFSFTRAQLETIYGGTLSDGIYTLHLQAKDLYGNLSNSFDVTFTLDTTTPDPSNLDLSAIDDSGASNTDNITNKKLPTITGNAEAGAVVQLFNNGQLLGQSTANNAGTWQIVTSDLTDGTYNLTASSTDIAGNVSTASNPLQVVIDTVAPNAPTNLKLTTASDTGASNSDNITKNATPTIQGSAEAGTTVRVFKDGQLAGQTTATVDGRWQLQVGPLTDGQHIFTANSEDKAGNISVLSNQLTVTVDTQIVQPSNLDLLAASDRGSSDSDNITNDTTPTIAGHADANSLVQLFSNGQLVGQTTTTTNGEWQLTTSSLTDGIHNLTAIATDRAGNISNASAPLAITLDSALPLLTLNTPLETTPLIPNARFIGSVDGTGSAVTALSYRFNNFSEVAVAFNATGSFDQAFDLTGLNNGSHILTITTTDKAGNVKTNQYNVTVILDREAPVITASLTRDTAPGGITNSDSITFDPTFGGTVIDASRVVDFRAGFDNTLVADFTNVTALRNADSSFSFDRTQLATIYGNTLPDGIHTLHLQAVDEFGNTSNVFDISFILDTVTPEPVFNLDAPSDSGVVGDLQTKFDIVTLVGQSEAYATVVLEQTGAVTTSDHNGQFSFTNVQLAIGNNSLTARATDIAGNENTFSTNIYRFSPPTAINLTGNTVPENSVNGMAIGQLSSTDPDAGDSHTYTLEDDAGGRFRIVGNQLQVADGTLLNFESSTQHSITVKSTDTNGLSNSFKLTIGVTNVNEAPSFTSTPISTVDLGSLYRYNIVTSDPDAADTRRIIADNLPSWLTLVDNLDGTATLSGTSTNFLDNTNINLKVTDAGGLTAIQEFTITSSNALVEGTNFTASRSFPVTIGATPSILSFKIDKSFDTTDIDAINDALEVALIDANGKSLVHTIASGRDAFFNWTEGESALLGAGASYDAASRTVSLNLTGITPTNAQLVFRLVNNDSDTTTSVRITDFAITAAPTGTQPPVQSDFGTQTSLNTGNVLLFNLLADVSQSFVAEYHRTSLNADSRLLYADIALRNIGSYSVDAPLIVAVNHISDPSVLVRNPDGFTPEGVPYYDFSKLVGDKKLDSQELTQQRSLIFYNPDSVQFTYDLAVLAQLNAAPVIQTQANKEIIRGHNYSYDVDATDPNGDSLTYKLLVSPQGMTIDSTSGLISWNPAVSNIGNQTIIVEVGDGRGGLAQQQYTLSVIDAPPNRPPIFTSTPVVDAAINTPYIYQAFAKDVDDDSLTFSLLSAPQGMTVDANTGVLSWTPNGSQLGTYNVTLAVADGRGGTAQQVFKVQTQMELGNHAPIIISDPVTQVNVVNSSSIIDGVIFGLKSLAPGGSVSSQAPTKLFSFNVNGSNFKDLGTLTLNGSAIDGDGLAASEKYGLLGFALSSTNSTLIAINPNTATAKALSTPLVGKQIRGAVFDLDDNLWVIDATNSELLNLNPLDGSILKSVALTLSGQSFSLSSAGDIAVDSQGKFHLTAFPSNANGAIIYTLDQTTGVLTQVSTSDPGKYLAGLTFASADNTNHLFGYEINLEDDIYSYDINANYARTILFPNIISEFNAGRGDLAAIVRKPRYSYSVQGIDPDNDSLSYSLVTAPTGMKIDTSTGQVTWDNPVVNPVPYDVTVRVQDGRGGVDTQSFNLQVNTRTGLSEIRGTIWEDSDSDGVRDSGERGLFGVQVYLDLNKNGIFDDNEPTTETNEHSEYKFTNLSPDTYIVREVLPNGFVYTSPQPTPLFGSNLLQNGSFEQGPRTSDFAIVGAGSNAIPYWNVTIGSVDYVVKSYWQSSDGNISIDLTGSPANGGLSQAFSTIPGKNYLVTFDLSTNPSVNSGQGIPMIVKAAGQSATFIGVSSGNYQDMKYFTYTWQFSANSATTTLEFSSQSPFYARGPVLDRVSVVEIISQSDFKQVVNLAADEIAYDINFGNSRINQSTVNNQPIFTSSNPPTTAIVGELWQYDAAATDLDKDALTYELIAKPDGMIVDPTTGMVRWKPTWGQSTGNLVQLGDFDTNGGEKSGIYDIILAVRDGNDGIDLQTFQVQVVAPNTAPVFTDFPVNQLEATVNYPIQYQFKAQDAEGGPITYSLDVSAPNAATLNSITGVLSWRPTAAGNSTFNIIANDNKGGKTSQSITITVSASTINANPLISSQPRKSIALGQTYLYTVQASDSNYDPLTYSLETSPQGMTIDNQGKITWQPGATQLGSNPVSIKVSDGRGGVVTQAFNIDVVSTTYRSNSAPSITSAPKLITNLERTYSYNLTGTDPDGDLLLWSLDKAPDGMVIDAQSGALRWQPLSTQIGSHTVAVRLTDAYGIYVGQEFTLAVTGVNTPPQIVSTPMTRAAQNQKYTYTVVATDPENDALTFNLGSKPAGMKIDSNGIIQWIPQVNQVGSQKVEVFVSDAQGAIATQIYTIEVGTTAINHAPSITSTPVYLASIGSAYNYQVVATDPDAGDRLTYQLLSSPTGMSIDSTTGLLTWNNTIAGNYQVVVGAVDAGGLGAAQGFTLTARANNAPVIRSTPVLSATPGSAYAYDIIASDVDGDRLTYTLDQASRNLGITLDTLGRLRWTPTTSNVGSHHVVLSVSDGVASQQQQEYDLVVAADTIAPKVSLIANYNQVNLGETVIFQARATDNIKVAGLQLLINNTPVVLDANGMARFTPNQAGKITAKAIATDTAGNIGQATFDVAVIDRGDVNAPSVSLDLGAYAGNLVTAPIDIKGSISDDGSLDYYRLLVAPVAGGEFKQILFVDNPSAIANGVLGKFDPSLLQNDSYILRLEVADNGGHISYVEEVVDVAGELKLGNFRLSFTDLSIPVTGIPITLTRTYDTLTSASTDDFGYGWRMEFRDTDLRTSLKRDADMEELGYYTAFKEGTRVYITLPGGKREAFTFKPKMVEKYDGVYLGQFAKYFYTPEFVADKGVTSTLTVENNFITKGQGTDQFYGFAGNAYNPEDPYFGGKYKLTTKEGVVYEIDAVTGDLLTVTDNNGNKLTYTDAGIYSSTGKQITFERDAQGRIASVKDPMGELIRYGYNANGDLVSVTDRENNTTRMEYNTERKHYLDKIIDPLNRTGVRNEYGDNGRLKEIVDVNGKAVEMTYDPSNSRQLVQDQLGHTTTYEYDARGNIVTEIDAVGKITKRKYDDNNYILEETIISDRSGSAGFTTKYTFDSLGNQLTKEDPLGNITRYTYGPYSQLLTETDPLGRTTTNTYSRSGNLLSTIDTTGKTTTYSYDIKGQLQSIISPNNIVTLVEYDIFGNVTKLSNNEGHQSIYTYDDNGNPLSETLKVMTTVGLKESVTSWTYDKQGRIKSITDPQQRTTHYEYNQLGKEAAVIDPLNRRTEFRYNEKGELIETTYSDNTPNDSLDNPRTLSEHDAAGREIVRIDVQNGWVFNYRYDAAGRLIETIYPDDTPSTLSDNPKTRTEYYNTGEVKAETDLDGNRIEYEYDALGRQTSIRDSRGYSTAYTFDAVGNKLTETDKQGRTTRFVYDTLGRLSGTYAPDGTYTTFNEAENRLTQTDALGRATQFNYDTSGHLLNTRFVDGTSVTNTYDSSGRLISTTDQDSETTKFEYDPQGRLKAVTDAKQQRTEYNYNDVGNLSSVEDALNQVVTYEYDQRGRRQAVILPGERRESITYDISGNIESITDFNGKTISYTYNSYNRITSKQLPNQTPTNYTYNLDGLLETTTDSRGTTTYKYDERGRLISRTDPYGPYIATDKPTIEYSYDELGRISSVKTAIGNTIYTYDEQNRLKTVTAPQGGTTTYHYDKLGNLIRTELPNNVVETRQYNSLNRLIEVKTTRINPVSQQEEIISKFKYTLDAEGNRQSVVERDGRQIKYKYDELDRLTEEINGDRTITYTYDAVGNRLSKTDSQEGVTTYIYNTLNQLTSSTINAVTTAYTYDNNGNLISEVTGTNSKTYRWLNDGENRLMGITINNASGTSNIEYRYDAQGIRVAQIVDGVETRFLVDTLQQYPQVLAEYDAAGNIKSSYVYGKDLISQSQGSEKFFYHTDGLGSTKVLTNASGQETTRYLYDAFGNLLSRVGSSDNAYLFAGEQRDNETGLDYLRARYYNSVTGRFISADAYEGTLTDPMSLHDYLYAHANPVMNIDPSGYFTLQEFGAALAISSIASGLGIVNGVALLNVLTGGSAYDSLARYDQFLAGFADIVTFSGSTKLREKLYGSTATSNHRGLFFNLGRFSGGLTGFGLGLAAPTALGGTTWGQKVLVGYDLFGAGFGSYLSTRKFLEGKGTAWDLLAYLPLFTYGSGLGLDWLATRGVVAADLAANDELAGALSTAGNLTQDEFIRLRNEIKGAEGWLAQASRWWTELRDYTILYRGQDANYRPILSPIARQNQASERGLEASYELVRRMQAEGLTNEEIASFTARFYDDPIEEGALRFLFPEVYPKIPASLYDEPLGAA